MTLLKGFMNEMSAQNQTHQPEWNETSLPCTAKGHASAGCGATSMHAELDCYGMTHAGLRRHENQDQFLVADLSKTLRVHQSSLSFLDEQRIHGGSQGQLMIVADGMGGHQGGKRASQIAVETMARYLLDTMPWLLSNQVPEEIRLVEREKTLVNALDLCQAAIEREGLSVAEQSEMGTTFTMGYLVWPSMHLLHLGDSRAYLMRQNKLFQLTEDQTIAEQLARMGAIERTEISQSTFSHTLWSYLGVNQETLQPELKRIALEVNDSILICSDGLTAHVSHDELQDALQQNSSAESISHQLMQLALSRGGNDNITIVIARVLRASTQAVEESMFQERWSLQSELSPQTQTVSVNVLDSELDESSANLN